MNVHLTEEEQLEMLKRWWNENGRSILIGVVLAVGAYFGWQGWQAKQANAQEEAASLYQNFSQLVNGADLTEEQRAQAADIASELKEKYSGGLYAANAALFMAKLAVDQDDMDQAEQELNWVLERHESEPLEWVVKQRLAQIAYARENYAQALELLDTEQATGFESSYSELKGDVFMQQEQYAQAQAAYEESLQALLPAQANRRPVIQMKLDAVKPYISSKSSGDNEGQNANEIQSNLKTESNIEAESNNKTEEVIEEKEAQG